jgi:hypothetical protein
LLVRRGLSVRSMAREAREAAAVIAATQTVRQPVATTTTTGNGRGDGSDGDGNNDGTVEEEELIAPR